MAWGSWYPASMTVGERKAKALRAAEKLGRERALDPVVIEGSLAATWWGKAWNRNLEGYADYANRLPRGRSYARHGSVLHLGIEPGAISALVQGSRSDPYEVKVSLAAMEASARASLIEACAGKLDSAEALLAGRFPEDMTRLLTAEKTGLFPHPRGIRFSCTCPDSADLCKHVAAALYGVGARLDRDPSLFFKLRKIELNALISRAMKDGVQKLLDAKGEGESARLRGGEDELSALFGIDLRATEITPIPSGPIRPSAIEAARSAGNGGRPGAKEGETGAATGGPGSSIPRKKRMRGEKPPGARTRKAEPLRSKHAAVESAISGLGSLADEISRLESRLKALLVPRRKGRRGPSGL